MREGTILIVLASGGLEGFLARHALHIALAGAWAVSTGVAWTLITRGRAVNRRATTPRSERDGGTAGEGDGAVGGVVLIGEHRRSWERQLAGAELVALLSGRVGHARDTPRLPAAQRQWIMPLLALASLGAASVHVAVCPAHFEESTLYGVFFVGAATAQLVWASAILLSPSRQLVVLGVVGNLAVVALWAVSRTAGLPVGPTPGVPEAAGAMDALATAYEVSICVVGSWLLWARLPLSAGARGREGAISAGIALVVAAGITTSVLFMFPLQS